MSDYFDRIERQLVARVAQAAPGAAATGRDRRHRPALRAFSVLGPLGAVAVVVVIVAVIVISGGRAHQPGGAPKRSVHQHVSLTLQAPAATAPAALAHAAATVRARMHALGVPGHVAVHGHGLAISHVPGKDAAQVVRLSEPGQLRVYDWEASVLLPGGRTDASQLLSPHHVTALAISQGVGGSAPGGSAAGAVTLYRAVSRAVHRQTFERLSGPGQFYAFAPAAGPACGALARGQELARAQVTESGRCLLAGPAPTLAQLRAETPPGISLHGQQLVVVKPKTAVLEAEPAQGGSAPPVDSAAARFYVLRDHPALTGAGLTHVRAAQDSGGQPDVTFGFTPAAARAFQNVTATVAHRGASVSSGTTVLLQHFAIALDGRLLSVPSIDFKQYPDGVVQQGAVAGAEIAGGLTSASARELAAVLRGGPLGVALTPGATG